MKQTVLVLSLIVSYLVGSIPSGYCFARYFFGIDVTKYGSGNIGATNVARVLGNKRYFFYIFLFDFFKAFMTVFLCEKLFFLSGKFLFLVAGFLLIGNGYSIFLRFRGGKGVATVLGILAFLFPLLLVCFVLVWIVLLLVSKQVFIASLGGTVSLLPAYYVLMTVDFWSVLFLVFIVSLVFFRHKNNLKGLMS
ncbi:glycerol-3-phosphate acyltransferase [Candidatus Dependentiae bacterium]|nr:glycerol-3-phosphate acyltransferase [Candidatus Dependentiae bacterium]